MKTRSLQANFGWAAELVNPSDIWPPPSFATEYYDRTWFIERFLHDASKTNFYQKISLLPDRSRFDLPQIWHFAFRNLLLRTPPWSPYGFVEIVKESVGLYRFSGTSEHVNVVPDSRGFHVETWFGDGEAEFCIASLHPFQMWLVDQTETSISTVRFKS
jgi:hypothetical protein